MVKSLVPRLNTYRDSNFGGKEVSEQGLSDSSFDVLNVLGGVKYLKSINGLLMHVKRMEYGTFWSNSLYCMSIFCTYIVWCKLIHLHEHLKGRSLLTEVY